MDKRQKELLAQLKKVVDVPVHENPLTNMNHAIRLAQANNLLWRWAKDGPYYEFRWTPATPPIRVPEAQANIYVVKRIISQMSGKTAFALPADSKSSLEYDITPPAKKLLLEAGFDEPAIAKVKGTGKDGKITVGDARKSIAKNE
jgi:pyruvate/2-oxoglutarate dehydrogenase complex dihydrolipoamide acyltransferase (E2) component